MAKIQKKQTILPPRIKSITDSEIREFKEFKKRFYNEYETVDGQKLRVFDYYEAGVKFGAFTRGIHLERIYYKVVLDEVGQASKLQKYDKLIDIVRESDIKKEYAEKKQVESLEKTIKEISESKQI